MAEYTVSNAGSIIDAFEEFFKCLGYTKVYKGNPSGQTFAYGVLYDTEGVGTLAGQLRGQISLTNRYIGAAVRVSTGTMYATTPLSSILKTVGVEATSSTTQINSGYESSQTSWYPTNAGTEWTFAANDVIVIEPTASAVSIHIRTASGSYSSTLLTINKTGYISPSVVLENGLELFHIDPHLGTAYPRGVYVAWVNNPGTDGHQEGILFGHPEWGSRVFFLKNGEWQGTKVGYSTADPVTGAVTYHDMTVHEMDELTNYSKGITPYTFPIVYNSGYVTQSHFYALDENKVLDIEAQGNESFTTTTTTPTGTTADPEADATYEGDNPFGTGGTDTPFGDGTGGGETSSGSSTPPITEAAEPNKTNRILVYLAVGALALGIIGGI